MYTVTIDGEKFNSLSFTFGSMEEVAIFAETCIATAVGDIDVHITKNKEEQKDA